MIHLSVVIEPEDGEDIPVVGVSFMRRNDIINELGEYKYTYGGWWKDRVGVKNFIAGELFERREENIFCLVEKIVSDIINKNIK